MSVAAYVESLVQDCATEIIEILEQGPLSEGQLRRALRMEHHVAMIVIDRALRLLVTNGRIRASVPAPNGVPPVSYRLVAEEPGEPVAPWCLGHKREG